MNDKNNLVITSVVVIVTLLIFGLSFLLSDRPSSDITEDTLGSNEGSNTGDGTSDAASTPDAMEEYKDWRAYEDELTGMTFLYPDDLSIKFTEGEEFNSFTIYDKNFVIPKNSTGQDIRTLRREVTIMVRPFSEEKFIKLTEELEKEIDFSDTLGVPSASRIVNEKFGITSYQLNGELVGPYLASLFRGGNFIFRVEAYGESQSIADGVLFTLNFKDKSVTGE